MTAATSPAAGRELPIPRQWIGPGVVAVTVLVAVLVGRCGGDPAPQTAAPAPTASAATAATTVPAPPPTAPYVDYLAPLSPFALTVEAERVIGYDPGRAAGDGRRPLLMANAADVARQILAIGPTAKPCEMRIGRVVEQARGAAAERVVVWPPNQAPPGKPALWACPAGAS